MSGPSRSRGWRGSGTAARPDPALPAPSPRAMASAPRRLRGVRAHLAGAGADGPAPAPLAPDTQAFMDVLAAMPVPDEEPPLAVRRAGFDAMLGQQSEWGIDASAVTCAEVTVPADGDSPPVPTRVYSAPGEGDKPVLLYFHGGGWTQGTAEAYGPFTAALCARGGFHVVSVEYRLAPEHPAPAASDDCFAVLKWLADGGEGSGLSLDSSRIALAGDSAGGHLTLVTAIAARDAGIPIAVQVPLCPVTDCRLGPQRRGTSFEHFAEGFLLTEVNMGWFIDNYLPDEADREQDWRVSRSHKPLVETC